MNKKIKIYFRNFHLVNPQSSENFYLTVKCEITKKFHKSPFFHVGNPIIHNNQQFFWSIDLYEKQDEIICKLVQISQDSQIFEELSEVRLKRQIYFYQEKQAIFYYQLNKIGILSYSINFELESEKIQEKNTFQLQQRLQDLSDNFENERYKIQPTPYQSINNSVIKFENYSNHSQSDIFGNANESFVDERQLFSSNETFLMDQSFNLSPNSKLSSLQKWIKKIQKVQRKEKKNNYKTRQFECIISQRFFQSKEDNNAKLNLINLRLNQDVDQNVLIKSLSLSILDQNQKSSQSLFECSFSVSDVEKGENLGYICKEIRFKNLLALIPQNKNIQVQMFIQYCELDRNLSKISGILLKDRFLSEEFIPLFTEDQNIFGKLGYKIKNIQNASVQCLPALDQNPFESSRIHQEALSNLSSSPEWNSNLKNKIRQRKLNNKLLRRQITNDFKIKKYSYDQSKQRKDNFYGLQSPTQNSIQRKQVNNSKLSINQESQFSSQNEFQRSNTQNIPYFKFQSENNGQKSNRTPLKNNQLGLGILHHNLKMSKVDSGSSPSKSSSNRNKQQYIFLRSTNLTDLRQEESEEDSVCHKGDTFNGLQKGSRLIKMGRTPFQQNKSKNNIRAYNKSGLNQPINRKKQPNLKQNLSKFITEINSITVILYESPRPEEQEDGKFLILKSDQGQTFITQTLFTNHLNLNWKNKFYQFTSSDIEISVYERTGNSSQCQNKYIGKTILKFANLKKSIKQNFYRKEIYFKQNPIGTLVILYDIFMQRCLIKDERIKNISEMSIKNTIQKRTRSINHTVKLKKNQAREEQKCTIKPGSPQKNRSRARTLQSSSKSIILPSIDKNGCISRSPKQYERGKNIKIGRSKRFLSPNMEQINGYM